MTDETTCDFGRIEHGCFRRLDFARSQSSNSSPGSCLANMFGCLEFARLARGAVMIVTLHLAVGFADYATTNAMAGPRKAADESMTVAIGSHAATGRNCRALGIGYAFVVIAG